MDEKIVNREPTPMELLDMIKDLISICKKQDDRIKNLLKCIKILDDEIGKISGYIGYPRNP